MSVDPESETVIFYRFITHRVKYISNDGLQIKNEKMKVSVSDNWNIPKDRSKSVRVWRKSREAQNPCCLKSSVKFPQSLMIWGATSSAGVGPLCFFKSTVNAAFNQEILDS